MTDKNEIDAALEKLYEVARYSSDYAGDEDRSYEILQKAIQKHQQWRKIDLADKLDSPYIVALFKDGKLCWCCKAEWDGDYQKWRGGDFNELLVPPSHFQEIPNQLKTGDEDE